MIFKFLNQSNNQPPIQTGFFYGWLIVGLSGMGIFFSGPGQTYSNSVFIESYIQDLSINQTTLSSIYSAATLISGLLLFIVGRLVDRFGRRMMMTLSVLMLGAACIFNSFVTGPVMLFFGFLAIRYFGQGSMTLIPNTLVSQWFIKYRGRALSFASLGGLVGAAVFPPLINVLIDSYGWQIAWRLIGLVLFFFFMPIAYCFVRNRPEDIGQLPDGLKIESPRLTEKLSGVSQEEESWTLAEAIRTTAFWCILTCGAIPAMINTGITFHIFTILGDQGIDRMAISLVLSVVPIASFLCSLLSGFIVERIKANQMLSLTFVLSIATPIILMFAQSYAAVILFAVVWGIAQGFMTVPLGIIWPNYYGRKNLGSIQGVTHAALVAGSALGPFLFGWSYDLFGNYSIILVVSSFIWASGAILSFFAHPPQRKSC